MAVQDEARVFLLGPDWVKLTGPERAMLDDGDTLPEWLNWWAMLAARLAYGDGSGHAWADAALFTDEHRYWGGWRVRREALSVSGALLALLSQGVSSVSNFTLAWGLAPEAGARGALARGALCPAADARLALLWLTEQDAARLAALGLLHPDTGA